MKQIDRVWIKKLSRLTKNDHFFFFVCIAYKFSDRNINVLRVSLVIYQCLGLFSWGITTVRHQNQNPERYSSMIFVLEYFFKVGIQNFRFLHPKVNVAQKWSHEKDFLKLFSLLNVFNLGIEHRIVNDFFIVVHDSQYDLRSFHEYLVLGMKFKRLYGQGLEILLAIKWKLKNIPNSVILKFMRGHCNRIRNRNVSVRYMSQGLMLRTYIFVHRNTFKTSVGLGFFFTRWIRIRRVMSVLRIVCIVDIVWSTMILIVGIVWWKTWVIILFLGRIIFLIERGRLGCKVGVAWRFIVVCRGIRLWTGLEIVVWHWWTFFVYFLRIFCLN